MQLSDGLNSKENFSKAKELQFTFHDLIHNKDPNDENIEEEEKAVSERVEGLIRDVRQHNAEVKMYEHHALHQQYQEGWVEMAISDCCVGKR